MFDMRGLAAAVLAGVMVFPAAAAESGDALVEAAERPMSKRADRFLADYKVSEDAVDCIGDYAISPRPRVRRLVKLDPHRFVVEFRRRGIFLNITEGPGGCESMQKNSRISFLKQESRSKFVLCRGDGLRVTALGGSTTAGHCDVGYFYELTKIDAAGEH